MSRPTCLYLEPKRFEKCFCQQKPQQPQHLTALAKQRIEEATSCKTLTDVLQSFC